MNCGIYAITAPSGRLYIGSSNHVNIRWRNHRHQLRKQIHHCVALQRAANVYGVDRLVFSVVELCCEADLLVREQAYIDGYGRKRLYNSTLQAGGMRGFVTSTETRAKMSAASLGKPKSTEAKANMSAYARQRSPEHLAKLAAAFTGKKASDVTRAKQSAAKRGKKQKPEHIAKVQATRLSRPEKSNKSGTRGVFWYKGKWCARISVGGVYKHLGRFLTLEAASAAILQQRSEISS